MSQYRLRPQRARCSREHGAVAAASPDGRQPTNALVVERRASHAQSPNLGHEPNLQQGLRRRGAMGTSSVSKCDVITPKFWTVSRRHTRQTRNASYAKRRCRRLCLPRPGSTQPQKTEINQAKIETSAVSKSLTRSGMLTQLWALLASGYDGLGCAYSTSVRSGIHEFPLSTRFAT
jgi:hypothetical protein